MNCNTTIFQKFYSIRLAKYYFREKEGQWRMHVMVKDKKTGAEDLYIWQSNWGFRAEGKEVEIYEHIADYGFTLENTMENPFVWEKI